LGIVTLGVRDLAASTAFYERLGWERCSSSMEGEIVWFRTADTHVGLFPYELLAEDCRIPPGAREGFGGITLAINVATAEEVPTTLAEAQRAGAPILKGATTMDWGGVSGYFADPDGYPWEVAFNPHFPIGEDGRLTIP
jgi:catechol 2,3-dioxygenase-like lactoylglutathione lyase family enzyme